MKKSNDYIVIMKDGRKLPFSTTEGDPKNVDIELQQWFEDEYFLIDDMTQWKDVIAIRLSNGRELSRNTLYQEAFSWDHTIPSYDDVEAGLRRLGLEKEVFAFEILTEADIIDYDYSWDTPEKIITNMYKVRRFASWGINSLVEISGTSDPDVYRAAHVLWLRLKDAFNAEAEYYDEEQEVDENYCLGSIGPVEEREVLRAAWFNTLDGDKLGDYEELTSIIEALHDRERLETGMICMGS